jgi:hypothetical protein
MGASKRDFEETRQRIILEVTEDYYQEHYDVFKPPNTTIKRVIPANEEELFKNDLIHKKLLSEYMKANKKLNDYKYDKRHK